MIWGWGRVGVVLGFLVLMRTPHDSCTARIRSKENENAKVVIELKLRLSTSTQVKNLIGQIVMYKKDVKALFVVLIDPDPNQLAELEQVVEESFEEENVDVMVFDFEGV